MSGIHLDTIIHCLASKVHIIGGTLQLLPGCYLAYYGFLSSHEILQPVTYGCTSFYSLIYCFPVYHIVFGCIFALSSSVNYIESLYITSLVQHQPYEALETCFSSVPASERVSMRVLFLVYCLFA